MDKRQKAVREYLLGGCTYRQLEKKYGISHATLHRCVLQYKARQQATLNGVGVASDPMKPQPNQPASLEQLQQLLEQERLRNKLLNTLLDSAEEELQVPIRKKFGTKRSKEGGTTKSDLACRRCVHCLVIAGRHFIKSEKIRIRPALTPSWWFSK